MAVAADTMPGGPSARIAGLGARLGAAVLDFAFLAVVGAVAGVLFGERIAPAGTLYQLLGLLVAVPYFAFFESRHGGGQALGKAVFKLCVVDRAGQRLPLGRATVRALLWCGPWFFNGIRLSRPSLAGGIAAFLAVVLVFGVGLASAATFFLGRGARQGLHDVAAGSYVVEAWGQGRPVVPRTPPLVVGGAATFVGLVAVGAFLGVRTSLSALADSPMMQRLNALPDVSTVLVQQTTTKSLWGKDAGRKQTLVRVQLWYRGPQAQVPTLMHTAASVVLWHGEGLGMDSGMQLTVTRGWDLGIAQWTTSTTETRSLDAWRAAD